jgi:NADPH:quinone reductase-like Zn-dependent oxidoreductase
MPRPAPSSFTQPERQPFNIWQTLTMRAYELGAMNGLDSWRLVERPAPQPGFAQVLVRVKAASLDYRDVVIANGQYPFSKPTAEMIPISDGAGEIIAVGPGVHRWQVGDRVAGIFSQSWQGGVQPDDAWATCLGGAVDGMLAEQVVLDAAGLVRVPDHLSWEESATLPCAGVTAWNALNGLTALKAGETVLALGTGGVSMFAVQLAAARFWIEVVVAFEPSVGSRGFFASMLVTRHSKVEHLRQCVLTD